MEVIVYNQEKVDQLFNDLESVGNINCSDFMYMHSEIHEDYQEHGFKNVFTRKYIYLRGPLDN